MAYPNVKLNASTGNDANSGAGPGDGVTAGTVITGTTASVATTNAYIGLYGTVDLSAVATDGSHAIQLNYATAGKQSLLAINGKKTTTASGTVTVTDDGGGVGTHCTVTGGDNVHAGAYPILIGSDYRYIATGGGESADFTIDAAVTAGTGIAYSEPMAVSVAIATLANLAAGQYSFAIGGKKGSMHGTLMLAAVISNTVVSQFNGWIFDIEANESITAANTPFMITGAVATVLPITIRGRSETDRTVLTFSGSNHLYSSGSSTSGGVKFENFDFVCSCGSDKHFYNAASRFKAKNCRWINGANTWGQLNPGSAVEVVSCYIEVNNSYGTYNSTYVNCVLKLPSATGASLSGLYINCKIIKSSGTASSGVTGAFALINCDLVNIIINITGASDYGSLGRIVNTSFTFTSAYAGYAITFNSATIYSNWVFYGGGITGCNYYNCTGLINSSTYAQADKHFPATNINPAYTDIANGDPTNTALQSQGYPAKHIGTSVNTNYPIGSYVAAPGAGGSTVYVPIPTEDE